MDNVTHVYTRAGVRACVYRARARAVRDASTERRRSQTSQPRGHDVARSSALLFLAALLPLDCPAELNEPHFVALREISLDFARDN